MKHRRGGEALGHRCDAERRRRGHAGLDVAEGVDVHEFAAEDQAVGHGRDAELDAGLQHALVDERCGLSDVHVATLAEEIPAYARGLP